MDGIDVGGLIKGCKSGVRLAVLLIWKREF